MTSLILAIAVVAQWELLPDKPQASRASAAWSMLPVAVVVPKPPLSRAGEDLLLAPPKPVQATAEAAPTPYSEVVRVIAILPTPTVGFVEYGCSSDARWCVAAVERWKCKAIGIEIDPSRAAAARERVREAGLENRITIITGDATTTDVQADVGVAYLYSDVLVRLKPRLERLRAFASYMHQPPIAAVRNGDTWIWVRPVQVVQQAGAVWNGQLYSHPQCNSPGCAMCNVIRNQLAAVPKPAVAPQATGDGLATEVDGQWLYWRVNGVCWGNQGTGVREGAVYGGRWLYRDGKMFDQQQQQQPAAAVPTKAIGPHAGMHLVKRCSGGKCWYEWVKDDPQ